jgi:integrase
LTTQRGSSAAGLDAGVCRWAAAGIEPLRRIYDLRHTFATFALRAGVSTFDLSRRMGAPEEPVFLAELEQLNLRKG